MIVQEDIKYQKNAHDQKITKDFFKFSSHNILNKYMMLNL